VDASPAPTLKRFVKNRGAMVGGALVLLLVLFALLGPALSSHDPYTSDFSSGIGPDGSPRGPSLGFPFGADLLFRDEFVRLAYGARLSLLIALFSTAIATVIGAGVGIVSGYMEGTEGLLVPWASVLLLAGTVALRVHGHHGVVAPGLLAAVIALGLARHPRAKKTPLLRTGIRLNLDTVLMRTVDVGLAFQFLLLVMAIGAALDHLTPASITLVLGLTGWLGTARLIRSKAILIRNLDYVVAARAFGRSTIGILLRHVAPNVLGPLIVIGTISVAQMIIAESALSYLGVGISPPTSTWGQMLLEGQDRYQLAPWMLIAPAGAILCAVLGFNLLGEGLRDALDPQDS
jgi:ABC-type dipeptide/oligopeptide/nickel transport system permease subunit